MTADNCAADGFAPDFPGGTVTATIIAGGGAGILEAETSTSKTIGLIWTPQFADLSVSVDYFDIEVRDEVDQFGPDNIVFSCYESEFFPTDPLLRPVRARCDHRWRRQHQGQLHQHRQPDEQGLGRGGAMAYDPALG